MSIHEDKARVRIDSLVGRVVGLPEPDRRLLCARWAERALVWPMRDEPRHLGPARMTRQIPFEDHLRGWVDRLWQGEVQFGRFEATPMLLEGQASTHQALFRWSGGLSEPDGLAAVLEAFVTDARHAAWDKVELPFHQRLPVLSANPVTVLILDWFDHELGLSAGPSVTSSLRSRVWCQTDVRVLAEAFAVLESLPEIHEPHESVWDEPAKQFVTFHRQLMIE